MPQLFHVQHLLVVVRVRLRITEVAEHEAVQVALGHVTFTCGQVREQSVEIVFHMIAGDVTDAREQPGAIMIIDKTVVENTERLQKVLIYWVTLQIMTSARPI